MSRPSPCPDPLARAADPAALVARLPRPAQALLDGALAVSRSRGEPVYLVGGPVRDALLGRSVRDLDVVVEGDGAAFAHELAGRTGGVVTVHAEFLTATVATPQGPLDVSTARQESYPAPAKLPVVSPADIGADLARRDFAINALALRLPARSPGDLLDPCGGLPDLRAGQVRALYSRSFTDDPTRLLRAVRYEQRLGFRLEPGTERLARQGAAERLLRLLTGPRLRDELARLLLEERRAAMLARAAELDLLAEVLPGPLPPDYETRLAALPAATEALGRPTLAAQPWAAAAAVAVDWSVPAVAAWADRLGLDRAAGEGVQATARMGRLVPQALRSGSASDLVLHEALHGARDEGLLALWLNAGEGARRRIRHYAQDVRDTKPDLTGADLLAAGCAEGPAIGVGLEAALRAKLAGSAPSREQQLAAALAAAKAYRPEPHQGRGTTGDHPC